MKLPAPSQNLRDRQREETREQILRAVGHQLEQGPLEDLSFAEIAKDAHVGERTVYRYFPTKEALLGAFWAWMQSQAVGPPEPKLKPPHSLPRIREGIKAPHDAARPMRILVATDAWEPQVNGVVRTLTRVVAELKAMGHAVEVISPDQFKTFPLPTYAEIKVAIGVYEPVQEHFKAFEPEAIHIATEGPIGLAARRICVEWKLPFTTSYHTRFPEYVSARLPLPLAAGYAYMKWFHKPSGRLMVATPTMRDELAGHGFRNISSWSRGVDTEAFHPRLRNAPDPYEGMPRPIFLTVGRVAVEKNIEAFLSLDIPGTKYVVGGGPLLETLTRRYPHVRFVGPRDGDELASYFAAADVFVFPSRTDTFGLVMLEALASGVPVAAFPVQGPLDVIGDNGIGVLDDDLGSAVGRALKIDPARCRDFALAHSWQAAARQFLSNVQPCL